MREEESIFARAKEEPISNRSAFLDGVCGGDAHLRKRVEDLLRTDDQLRELTGQHGQEDLDETVRLSRSDSRKITSRSNHAENSTPDLPAEAPGERILYFGDYELHGEIARGAMGVVYRATQRSLKRTVAVKMIRSTLLSGDSDIARFQTEAEAAASLDHPNIVPIYEVGQHDGQHYFSMRLIEGGTLKQHADSIKGNPQAIAGLVSTVAGAIHDAHQRGVLHRDLKPGNILIDETGEPHVTDFGLAKQMESEFSMTLSGQIIGTPQYMAPEQAEGGAKALSVAADVYSLGAILYELLSGRPPHEGDSLLETLRLVAEVDPDLPSKLNSNVDRDLETIAIKCLSKNPENRYESALSLKNDLDRWLRGEPILARPVGTVERCVKLMKRKPIHATAAGLAVAFLLTLGIGGPIAAFRQGELRLAAEDAKNDAKEEQRKAEVAQGIAEEKTREMALNLYASEMNLVETARNQAGGANRMTKLLNHWRPDPGQPDLRGWEWYYLQQQLEQAELLLEHPQGVSSAEWTPDGKRIVTACDDNLIRVWNAVTGQEESRIERKVAHLTLSPDGTLIASTGDSKLMIHDLETGALKLDTKLPDETTHVAWKPDGLQIAVGVGKYTYLIEPASGQLLKRLRRYGNISSLRWHPTEPRIAITFHVDFVVCDTESNEVNLFEKYFGNGPVRDSAWDAEGKGLFVCGFVGLYQLNPGTRKSSIHLKSGKDSQTIRVDFFADDRIAWVGQGRVVHTHNPETGESMQAFHGHLGEVTSLQWNPDGKRLLSSDSKGMVRIWNTEPKDDYGNGLSLSWSPNGEELLVGQYGKVAFLSPTLRRITRSYEFEKGGAYQAVLSPSGDQMILGRHSDGARKEVSICEASSGKLTKTIDLNLYSVTGLSWEPKGDRFLALSYGYGAIRSIADGSKLYQWEKDWRVGMTSAWHPEGGRCAIGQNEVIEFRDLDTNATLARWSLESGVSAMAWHPNGTLLATARESDATVEIWEMPAAKKVGEIGDGALLIGGMDWSPDGDLLVMGGLDGMIRFWSFSKKRIVLTLQKEHKIYRVLWDPSGRRLAVSYFGAKTEVLDAGELR